MLILFRPRTLSNIYEGEFFQSFCMVFTLNFIAEFKFSAMNGLSFINTLTANYDYSRSNRENLSLPIQMQLSEKPKTFCQYFIAFLESTLNLNILKKHESHSSSISEVIESERRAYLNA